MQKEKALRVKQFKPKMENILFLVVAILPFLIGYYVSNREEKKQEAEDEASFEEFTTKIEVDLMVNDFELNNDIEKAGLEKYEQVKLELKNIENTLKSVALSFNANYDTELQKKINFIRYYINKELRKSLNSVSCFLLSLDNIIQIVDSKPMTVRTSGKDNNGKFNTKTIYRETFIINDKTAEKINNPQLKHYVLKGLISSTFHNIRNMLICVSKAMDTLSIFTSSNMQENYEKFVLNTPFEKNITTINDILTSAYAWVGIIRQTRLNIANELAAFCIQTKSDIKFEKIDFNNLSSKDIEMIEKSNNNLEIDIFGYFSKLDTFLDYFYNFYDLFHRTSCKNIPLVNDTENTSMYKVSYGVEGFLKTWIESGRYLGKYFVEKPILVDNFLQRTLINIFMNVETRHTMSFLTNLTFSVNDSFWINPVKNKDNRYLKLLYYDYINEFLTSVTYCLTYFEDFVKEGFQGELYTNSIIGRLVLVEEFVHKTFSTVTDEKIELSNEDIIKSYVEGNIDKVITFTNLFSTFKEFQEIIAFIDREENSLFEDRFRKFIAILKENYQGVSFEDNFKNYKILIKNYCIAMKELKKKELFR